MAAVRATCVGGKVPEVSDPDGMPLPADESSRPTWRDSSLDLENGLDVTELYVDVVLPLAPLPMNWEEHPQVPLRPGNAASA
jgi:hypothetical protein